MIIKIEMRHNNDLPITTLLSTSLPTRTCIRYNSITRHKTVHLPKIRFQQKRQHQYTRKWENSCHTSRLSRGRTQGLIIVPMSWCSVNLISHDYPSPESRQLKRFLILRKPLNHTFSCPPPHPRRNWIALIAYNCISMTVRLEGAPITRLWFVP